MALARQTVTRLTRCIGPSIKNTSRSINRWVAPTLRELEKRKQRAGPQPPQPRSTFLEWNYDAEIFAFAKRLGETFNEQLLRRAFTHRSYIIQQEMQMESFAAEDNKELIKEGEQFISGFIKEECLKNCSADATTSIEEYLTSVDMLSHVASHMGMRDLILSADFPVEKLTMANTFKAVVGTLKLSADETTTKRFVRDFLLTRLNGKDVFDVWEVKNPYEYLLCLLKSRGIDEVEPRLCNQSASNTILANYQVGLYNDRKLLGIGWGESIDIAKDTAALDAIQKLQENKISTVFN